MGTEPSTPAALAGSDTQLMNYLVRMVVPMRREFGRHLDVRHFLHDFAYAREVLDEALRSQDPRLLDYAHYIERRLHGPRETASPKPAAAPAPGPVASAPPAPSPVASSDEDDARARVLRRYTTGLR